MHITIACSKGLVECKVTSLGKKLQAGGPQIPLPTGRRDGVVSLASAVDVPGPTDTVTQAIAAFNSIGLNVNDLTTLLGTNSCHC